MTLMLLRSVGISTTSSNVVSWSEGISSFSPTKPTLEEPVSLGMRSTPAVSKIRGPDDRTTLAASRGCTSSEET